MDVHVFDVAQSYQDYVRTKAETGREPAPRLSQDQLQEMMNKVKTKK